MSNSNTKLISKEKCVNKKSTNKYFFPMKKIFATLSYLNCV